MKCGFVLGFLLVLFFFGSFCYGSANTIEVIGFGECADCKENNIKTSQALSGLKVTIDCKLEDGRFQTRGVGKLNEEGQFKVFLSKKILKDGKLSEECYEQLHNAADTPCAFHKGLEASKITFMSMSNQQHTFGPIGELKFSSAICTSSTIWPPFPKSHPWYKRFHHIFPNPPVVLPPIPNKKPYSPPIVKPEPKPQPEPQPKPGPNLEPKPKHEPKPEPKPKHELKPKPKPKPEPKPEPKPKPNPKQEPKPKHEPKREPKPKPEPKVEPKPKLEPKPEPKPKHGPKSELKPKPETNPCPPKILSPPNTVFKQHPKTLPPIPPIKEKTMPTVSAPKLPPKWKHHPLVPMPLYP